MIREMIKTDIPILCDLNIEQHKQSFFSHLPYERDKLKNYYFNIINNPQRKCWVIYEDNIIVGGCAAHLTQYTFSYQAMVVDTFFYIKPKYRKGLLAKQLYDKIYDWAKLSKALEVHLTYAQGGESNRIKQFYKRMGYKPVADYYRKEVI